MSRAPALLDDHARVVFEPIVLDAGAYTVRVHGNRISDRHLEKFELLRTLMYRAPEVLTDDELRAALWGDAQNGPFGQHHQRARGPATQPIAGCSGRAPHPRTGLLACDSCATTSRHESADWRTTWGSPKQSGRRVLQRADHGMAHVQQARAVLLIRRCTTQHGDALGGMVERGQDAASVRRVVDVLYVRVLVAEPVLDLVCCRN